MSRLFSIVIPTFNYGRFLRRAIDSAVSQKGDDFEVIVVDDGSTDDSPQIAASYGSRIGYVRQANAGVFNACKRGLKESTGRFLIFFDADDRLAPHALEIFRREIARAPEVGLIAGRHVNMTVTGPRPSPPFYLGKSRKANFRSFLFGRSEICTGASAIRREAVGLIGRYEGELRVGIETACVAHSLWFFDAVAVTDLLLEVHEHPGRLRDNMVEIRRAGQQLVDVVFDPEILPPEAGRYREPFRARLLRDRARSFHKAGFHDSAVNHFHEAMRGDPRRTLCDVRNVRRYLISRIRRRFAVPPSLDVDGRASREPGVVEVSGHTRIWGHRRHLTSDAIEFVSRCAKLGDVVKLHLARPTYLLSDPRDIAHVFIEVQHRYRRTGLQTGFHKLFGRGLFSRTGRSHIEHRRLVQPLLHRGRLDDFIPPIQETLGETLLSWNPGQVLEANAAIMEFTKRAAGRMVLGAQRPEDTSELFDSIRESHQRVVRNMNWVIPLSDRLPTRRNRIMQMHIARLDAIIQRLTDAARANKPAGNLLSRLVHLRDPSGAPLDDRQIRDHVLLIFLAAYEPTATALTWLVYLLAKHPDVQRKLQAEIDAHTSTPASAPEAGGTASQSQRPIASQVVMEGLRLYPSTWLLARRAAETDQLPSGASIPAGCDVFASPFAVHRDPRFYEQPEDFRPERFATGLLERRAAGRYIPFGLGPTACLGEHLARMLMTLTLEGIVSRFDLDLHGDDVPRCHSGNIFTMQPDRPIYVTLNPRST